MTQLLYTRAGAGARRGVSWRDARPFAQLAADLRGAGPGDRFAIGFACGGDDPVMWAGSQVGVSASGAPGRPIRIEAGCTSDASSLRPLRGAGGTRFFLAPNAMGARMGAPFRLTGGASYLTFSGFRIDGASADGFVKFASGAFSDLTISGFSARNVGRVIECERETSARNLVIEDCDAVRISRGFARFRRLDHSVLRNLILDADRVDLGGANVTQLIAISAGSDVRFENIQLRNAVNVREYVQGDGLVCERGTSRFSIRNCHAQGMGDGGFDLKTTDFVMEDCSASDCQYGIRIWSASRNVLRRCTVRSPRRSGRLAPACIEAHGRAELAGCQLQAGQDASVFRFSESAEGAPLLRVHGGAIRLDGNARLVTGAPSGVVELHDVAVNGEMRSGRYTAGQAEARG
jgi:parallel beta-helix repeat protein